MKGYLKRALALVMMIMLLASSAQAEFDLSGVKELDGRLVGEVSLPGISEQPLKIDCPVPKGFAEEQCRRIAMEYTEITDAQLKKTLKDLGYDVSAGVTNTYAVYATYTALNEIFHESAYVDRKLKKPTEPTEQPLIDAKERMNGIVEAFGGTVYTDFLQALHFGEELVYDRSLTDSTVALKLKALSLNSFQKMRKNLGLEEEDLSIVYGLYGVNGLPVMYQHYMKDDGYESYFAATFKADGSLLNCNLLGMPKVQDMQPVELPERSWEALLQLWLANCYWPSGIHEDFTYEDSLFGEVTQYARYDRLTALEPCYISKEAGVLEPGYYATVEVRVVKDDSLEWTLDCFADASTFTRQ